MSRSYKNTVSQPNQEQSPKKFKKQFNKKIRQKTKKTLDDFLLGDTTEEQIEVLYDEEEEQRRDT